MITINGSLPLIIEQPIDKETGVALGIAKSTKEHKTVDHLH